MEEDFSWFLNALKKLPGVDGTIVSLFKEYNALKMIEGKKITVEGWEKYDFSDLVRRHYFNNF